MVIFAGNSSSYTYDSMGNLLQMSITSGQDTDSRQFTLAANSHYGKFPDIPDLGLKHKYGLPSIQESSSEVNRKP